MTISIGADHRGFTLKETLKVWLSEHGYIVVDKGAHTYVKDDDYTTVAFDVSAAVINEESQRGIVICGSGIGVSIVANKIKGIRCGLGISQEQVMAARRDDDITILALAADYLTSEDAVKMVDKFITTDFSGEERHKKRLDDIARIEET